MAAASLIIGLSLKKNNVTEAETGPGEIILYLSSRGGELFGKDLIENFIFEYEEKNPGIRIYPANAVSDAQNQKEPDIYFFDEGELPFFIAGNYLAELNSFTNYESGARQPAIPLVSFMDLFFYNIDILTEAGYASPPKTRDEILACARSVSRGNTGASGLAFSLSLDDRHALSRDIFSWMWASGNNFWSEDGKPSINNRPIINDFTFLGTLYREGLLSPGIFNTTGEQRIEQFIQGKTAMMIASAKAIPYLREKMGDEKFGITTIPAPVTDGRYGINISAIYTGMSSNSAYPQEAGDFLVFLAGKSSLLCEELKAIPGIAANIIPGDYENDEPFYIIPGDYINNDPFYSKAWGIYEFDSTYVVDSFSEKPRAVEYYDAFLDELEIFFDSGRTSQQTVTAIQQRWEKIYENESAGTPGR